MTKWLLAPDSVFSILGCVLAQNNGGRAALYLRGFQAEILSLASPEWGHSVTGQLNSSATEGGIPEGALDFHHIYISISLTLHLWQKLHAWAMPWV